MSAATAKSLLEADAPRAASAVRRVAGDLLDTLQGALDQAMHGKPSAVRIYVEAYRDLNERLLSVVHEARPDLVIRVDDRLLLVDVKGKPSEIAIRVLEHTALEAPFSPWVRHYGAGSGVALALLAHLRSYLESAKPLQPPKPGLLSETHADKRQLETFLELLSLQLRVQQSSPLDGIRETFVLSKTELASIFSVSRQAIDQWREEGVPAGRQDKVAVVAALADLLARQLKPDRVPGVVRRKARAYQGRSMLDLIRLNRHEELLDRTRATFDWSATA